MSLTQILEFAERLFKVWIGTAWGKGALALIVGGVLSINSILQYLVPPLAKVIGITVTIPETPIGVSFTLICLGILLLILSRLLPDWSEQSQAVQPPNPHDVRLLANYRELITPQLIQFLTEHTFRLPYRVDTLNPLEVLAYEWRGAHHEFLDLELKQSLSNVIGAARGLCGVVANRIFLDRNNPAIGSPLTDVDLRLGIQPGTREAIEQMNTLAKGVVTTANNFERLARQKIPS
ncbi:hypothetical protein [Bradyrhizobium sp. CCBAU 45394]|uniref:hypothetical protein n=1 Tax=Bradyrhizobium sp. CCBAU 45394 TaxID=1325087 RepID=UPI002302E574|nr:hypothetical protein [Bradyrhizobium sp. CCBAU 45394]